jgi:hypothetical protein
MNLVKNVINSLRVLEMPGFERFPKAQQVTFNYYAGVISFLDEDYLQVGL